MSENRRLVLLGFDGQDPKVTERLMSEGKLPNFQRLAEGGGYARLSTTNPAQSPVAWTTLATGVGPGHHGVFDFLKTVPGRMSIDLAIQKLKHGPDGAPLFERVRETNAFWDITTAAGIHTSIIRWPVTFPAEKVSGHFISGLGAPDVQGRLGNYAFFTTQDVDPDDKAPEKVHKLRTKGKRWIGQIQGPMVARLTGAKPSEVPFQLEKRGADEAVLHLPDTAPITLRTGEWSPWLRVEFNIGRGRTVSGILKGLLLQCDRDCRFYLSPIEIDPENQSFDISSPPEHAANVVSEFGLFHTLGMPEDTKGVTDRRFGLERFLDTCNEVMREREFMLNQELELLPEHGVLAVVFDTLDRIQHLFWASEDPAHPIADQAWQGRWGSVIEEAYEHQDAILGSVLDRVDGDTTVLVFSDHGFSTFRRAVHLNRWLTEQGYMQAELGADDKATTIFRTVDWSRTQAYACGFGGIYLNLRGREAKGVVSVGDEADKLRREIAEKIVGMQDEETGGRPICEAFVRDDVFAGPLMNRAPDVFVGFEPGYRASWQTAIGGGLKRLVEDNAEPWCGDHLVHPECVPGVLFANRPLVGEGLSVYGIAPTVLSHFGLDLPEGMSGKSVLGEAEG